MGSQSSAIIHFEEKKKNFWNFIKTYWWLEVFLFGKLKLDFYFLKIEATITKGKRGVNKLNLLEN